MPQYRVEYAIAALAVGWLIGCQQQMARQPSFRPDEPSPLFADGRAARPAVPGTVARGQLRTDLHLYTARATGQAVAASEHRAVAIGLLGTAGMNPLNLMPIALARAEEAPAVATFPFPVTRKMLEHGHHRYMIYCVVCHDPLGTGRGMIVERGYTPPPSYHIDRLRQAPAGHFYNVITNGYGSMPDYREQIPPRDRWAIVGYIRALQLSQHFPDEKLSVAMRTEWSKQDTAAAVGGARE